MKKRLLPAFGGCLLLLNAHSQTLQDVTANGSATDRQITVHTSLGGAMYTGRQVGGGYYNPNPYGAVFYAMTDATNPSGNHFFSGYHSSSGVPGSGINSFYVRGDGQAYFAGKVGIGLDNPTANLDVNGGAIFRSTVNSYSSTPLTNGSYDLGNFHAFVSNADYNAGVRPGYGFHVGGIYGTYLYANRSFDLRLKDHTGSEASVLTTANMGTNSGINADKLDGLSEENFASAGVMAPYNFRDFTGRTFLGSINGQDDAPVGNSETWWNVISTRHRNGLSDGNNYGLQIINGMTNYLDKIYFRAQSNGSWQPWREIWHTGNFNPAGYLSINGGSVSGDVEIGSTAAQKSLSVNGDIKTRKVKVTQTGWPDYVFDSSYHLTPLADIEHYVQKNKHLPNIPSASEVSKDGLDLGDNQAQLLKKIEELTLYIIKQDKQLSAEKARNDKLESRLETIDKQLQELKK